MKIKPSPNKIIIKIKNVWNDEDKETKLKTDVSYEPHHHIRYDAIVAGIPDRYEGGIICSKYIGSPSLKSYANVPGRNLYCYKPEYYYIGVGER